MTLPAVTLLELRQRYRRGELPKPQFIAEAFALHRQFFAHAQALEGTEVREVRITREGLCFTVGDEGIRLWCPGDEGRVVPLEVLNFGAYEAFETAVLDRLLPSAGTFVDAGASLGWHALRWARRLPGVRVHAFEPVPGTLAWLRRNIAENDLAERVAAHGLGLAEREGAAEFFLSPGNGTNASLVNVAAASDVQRVPGRVTRLDAFVERERIAPVFLKCDVEGAELRLLQGAGDTLARHRPMVFAELLRKWCAPFGCHPNDVLALMAGHGYACHALGAAGVRPLAAVDDDTPETHYLFLHPGAHAAALRALMDLAENRP